MRSSWLDAESEPGAGEDVEPAPILLVDDQPRNLQALTALLESSACRLVSAQSADEALLALLKTDFAAIVLDIQMPGMSGLEMARLVKQRQRTRDVPILFLTAHLMDSADMLHGYELGAVDYLTKPFEPKVLQSKVAAFVELWRQRRALAGANVALRREVAEREAAQHALRLANEELEERVRQRTAQLEAADRRKDEFLALLAHELRNPLAPIRNAAAILKSRESLDSRLQWCRDVIDRQVAQMARLLDDLLDVSRITRGRLELRRAPVDLRDVVSSALEASRPLLERARVDVVETMPETPVAVFGDAQRLAQAVSNVLNNSARYCDPGGRVHLSVHEEVGGAIVRVVDDGIGIPPEMLTNVFEPFVQVDRASPRSQGGLGIGLALVRELIHLHGGNVQAESRGPGTGSSFTLRLPLDKPQAPDEGMEARAEPAVPPRRILVADDNRDAADSLGILLTQMGHVVRVVYDGQDAVDAVAAFAPEVALLDLGMPVMDGFDAARSIRERVGPRVLLVALSGWGQEEDRRRAREAGFDDHVLKPVAVETLAALLVPRGEPGR
jgi:signal transduction histidine kinase